MPLRNTTSTYGWVAVFLHWFMAAALLMMYALGNYMSDLEYYDRLYHTLPSLHKAVGVLLGILLFIRLLWVYTQPRPLIVGNAPAFTQRLAMLGHFTLYALLVLLLISGYLISTAKGHPINVFGWFEVPALLPGNGQRAEWAGDIHESVATLFLLMVGLHALAAFIHHFYWKDNTLTRMLGKG